jgi:nitroreductase
MSHPRRPSDGRDVTGHLASATLDQVSVAAAVAVACRAPSIHNTQPWRWELRDQAVDVRTDRERQLQVADPDGHSLLISCGAAIALTEIALRAQGWGVQVERWPDQADPDLLARLHVVGRSAPDPDSAEQVTAARHRRSERRPFGEGLVADDVIEQLRAAAAAPGVFAHFPTRADELLDLAVAISYADRSQRDDPAYAAEVARWVHADDRATEGVSASSIPRVPADQPRHTDIPLRDFEIGIPGAQLIAVGVDERPLITVIFTPDDGPADQLRAGEAMMRLMIRAEIAGIASCPLSQSIDMLAFRARLRTLMDWTDHPQMMLRLGPRPTGPPAPLTPRRPVEEVLISSRF